MANVRTQMTITNSAQDVEDACWVLEYLVHDLVLGPQLYELFLEVGQRATVHSETETAVRRMYTAHILLTLNKVSEFLARYRSILPEDLRESCRALNKELSRRRVRKLRNTFIGHILNNKTGRPITNSEINEAFNTATDNDLKGFLKWVHEPGVASSVDTVVGTLQRLHTRIRSANAK